MTNCWKVEPSERPTFEDLHESLHGMLMDDEVLFILYWPIIHFILKHHVICINWFSWSLYRSSLWNDPVNKLYLLHDNGVILPNKVNNENRIILGVNYAPRSRIPPPCSFFNASKRHQTNFLIKVHECKACFKPRVSHMPNALETIDNQLKCLIASDSSTVPHPLSVRAVVIIPIKPRALIVFPMISIPNWSDEGRGSHCMSIVSNAYGMTKSATFETGLILEQY
jgi:hypothetical protein